MNLAQAQEQLFGDVLACEELRAVSFLPGVLDSTALITFSARSEALLRALAVVEDGVRNEEPEQAAADHAMHRIEAKLDLLTVLVANLSPSQDPDPVQSLHWSARGCCLTTEALVAVGTSGRFRVQPADWLPSVLTLPATVLACATDADGRIRAWLSFGPLSSVLQAALERHLFRIHRRGIAESRRPR